MGRTTADKKKMLLKIYHTKKEPFNLKELTKLAKAAGLAEAVQDVNTQLMDDNYVSSDKIGTGNYFWAFPGRKVLKRRSSSTRSVAGVMRDDAGCVAEQVILASIGVGGSHHAIEANSHATLVNTQAKANLKRAQDRLAKAKVAEQEAKSEGGHDGSRAAKLKKLADLKTRRGQLEQRLRPTRRTTPRNSPDRKIVGGHEAARD